ncbi:transglycosylase SLT domain-containing protein [Halovulum sp. GXIMD14794]
MAVPPILPRAVLVAAALALAACGGGSDAPSRSSAVASPLYPNETPELRSMIVDAAQENQVPVSLVQRVVVRESSHRPEARNGPYYGLMQIHPQTARTMGYKGPPSGLLDAETNLRYAVRYLRGAWMVSDGSPDQAVKWYSQGYYYEAKRRGLLEETGLR